MMYVVPCWYVACGRCLSRVRCCSLFVMICIVFALYVFGLMLIRVDVGGRVCFVAIRDDVCYVCSCVALFDDDAHCVML